MSLNVRMGMDGWSSNNGVHDFHQVIRAGGRGRGRGGKVSSGDMIPETITLSTHIYSLLRLFE